MRSASAAHRHGNGHGNWHGRGHGHGHGHGGGDGHTNGYRHDELATDLSVELVELLDPGAGLVVEVRGELGADTAALLAAVFATVHAQQPPAVAVDLSEVSFLDSMGLSTLLEARARLMLQGASFGVRGISRPARRLLRAAGVSDGLEPLAPGRSGPDGTVR